LVLAHAAQNGTPLHEAEREILGASHAELGAYLLGLWGFCDGVVEALAFHHDPANSASNQFDIMTAVHAADVLVNQKGVEGSVGKALEVDHDYLADLGLSERLPEWQNVCCRVLQEGEGK
jgi:HD-like signal output (HDOD) protein